MLEEQWVSLPDFPNYEISNYGRVANIKTGRDLTASLDKNGYPRVALYRNGERFDRFVHRLVAECYFLNYRDGIEVKHKSKDKTDCSVLNLTLGDKCRLPAKSTN